MATGTGLTKSRRELTKLWLTYRVALVVVLVVGGAIIGALKGYDAWTTGKTEERQAEIQKAAQASADAARTRIAKLLATLAGRADEKSLATLLASGSKQAIEARAAQLAASDKRVLKVWLLPPGANQIDYSSKPPLGYASLELVHRAEQSSKTPLPEAILIGKEGQHIAVLRPIESPGGTLAGHLLWALDVAAIKNVFNGVDTAGGYAELIQPASKGKAVVLARAGDKRARQGAAAMRLAVRGTGWRVAFWPPPRAADSSGGAIPLRAGAGAALALVLALGGLLLWRRRRAPGMAAPEAAVVEPGADAPPPPTAPTAAATRDVSDEQPPPIPVESTAGGEEETVTDISSASLPGSIFRAYDIRGVVGKTLTEEIVRAIGRAIGSEAFDQGQQTLVVGYDGRTSSPDLAAALAEGLRATGRDVIDIGRVPTPVLYFATHFLDTGSGVMVTGSHNPPDYNGLKIMIGGETLFGERIAALRERIEAGKFTTGEGAFQSMEMIDEYIRRVSEDVPVALGNSFKVVVDCGNGVAGVVAPKLLQALGHDVIELYCEVDGNFPNHHPDPSQPENLRDLIAAVKEHDADLGLAFDGDGDRLGVVDPSGAIIWPDRQMMLYARDVLSRNPGAEIIFDVKCSSRLPKVIKKLGGKPLMWKTGHSFIKNKLQETGAPLAGEMSGHIFFKERWYGFDDGIYTAARLLEILTGFKQKPAAIFAKLPNGVSTPELRLDFAEGEHLRFMEKLGKGEQFGEARVTTIDGLRVDYPDSWGLVRASNTTPSLVLRFEADTNEALDGVKNRFREVLLAIDPRLELPF